MSHTPGPWKCVDIPAHEGLALVGGADDKVLWYYLGEKDDIEKVGAAVTMDDARLIAAAPELLEALRLWIDGTNQHKRIQYGKPWEQEAYKAGCAAITKATGEEPCPPSD